MLTLLAKRFVRLDLYGLCVALNGNRASMRPIDPMAVHNQLMFGLVIKHRHPFRPDDYESLFLEWMKPAYEYVRADSTSEAEPAQSDIEDPWCDVTFAFRFYFNGLFLQ
jgi:hypothetical protein